jgi:hypothetical protein
MIRVTGPSLSATAFMAATYIKRGAVCRSCKHIGGRWIIAVAFPR